MSFGPKIRLMINSELVKILQNIRWRVVGIVLIINPLRIFSASGVATDCHIQIIEFRSRWFHTLAKRSTWQESPQAIPSRCSEDQSDLARGKRNVSSRFDLGALCMHAEHRGLRIVSSQPNRARFLFHETFPESQPSS